MFYGLNDLSYVEEGVGSRSLGVMGAKNEGASCRRDARDVKKAERQEKRALKQMERLNKAGQKANERYTKCRARGRACRGPRRRIERVMKKATTVAEKIKTARQAKIDAAKALAACEGTIVAPDGLFVPFQEMPAMQVEGPFKIAPAAQTPIVPGPVPGTATVLTPTGQVTLPDDQLPDLMAAGGFPVLPPTASSVAPAPAAQPSALNFKNVVLLAGIGAGALAVGWFYTKQRKRKA